MRERTVLSCGRIRKQLYLNAKLPKNMKKTLWNLEKCLQLFQKQSDAISSTKNLAADRMNILYFGVNDAAKSGIKTGFGTKGKREEG